MLTLVTFFIVFIAGPAAFAVLVRQARAVSELRVLVVLVIALMSGGVVAARMMHADGGFDPFMAMTALVMLWCAWIALLVVGVAAFKRRNPDRLARKWAYALGAVATTLPWMGLVVARWMAG